MAETAGESGVINPSFNELFNSNVIGRRVEEMVDPSLMWARPKMLTSFEGISERVIEGPMYQVDSNGNRTTPGQNEYKAQLARKLEGTAYPRVKVSGYDVTEYGISSYGVAIEFTEKDRQESAMNRKKWNRVMTETSRAVQEFINMEIFAGTLNSFSFTSGTELSGYIDNELAGSEFGYETTYDFVCGTLDEDYYWDDPETAMYLQDIRQIKTMGKNIDGYKINFDTMFVHNTIFEKIDTWANTNNRSWETSPLPGGREIGNIAGMNIVSVDDVDGWSGNENYAIIKDSGMVPATSYYWTKPISPEHTKWSDDSKLQVREAKPADDYNTHTFYLDLGLRTIMYEPKYVGVVKIAA